VLESWAGRSAAERAKPDEVLALRRSAEAFGDAVTRNDLPSLVRLANEFYDVLFAASRNQVAAEWLKSLHARISFLRATSMSNPGRAPHSLAEMRAIARAIERRDPDAAAAACVRHVEMAAKSARRRFAELAGNANGSDAAALAERRRKASNR
jgi:DNA-binding GntR family transcriptional regulator